MGDLSDLVTKLGLGSSDIHLKDGFRNSVESYYSDLPEKDLADVMKLAMTIKKRRGIGMDDICTLLGWSYSKVSRIVTSLECDGFISVDLLQHCSPRMGK